MAVAIATNAISVVRKSTHQGTSIKGFPDVCTTPSPGGPVPVPYPNAAGYGQQSAAGSKTPGTAPVAGAAGTVVRSAGNEAGTLKGLVTQGAMTPKAAAEGAALFRQTDSLQLKTRLHGLHQEILSLPPGNPNRWHKLLDDYVILTAELYRKLSV